MTQEQQPIKHAIKISKKGRLTIPKEVRSKIPYKLSYEMSYIQTPGDWFIQIRELKP